MARFDGQSELGVPYGGMCILLTDLVYFNEVYNIVCKRSV